MICAIYRRSLATMEARPWRGGAFGSPTAAWRSAKQNRACAARDRPALHHRGAEVGVAKKPGADLAAAHGWRTVQEGVEVKLARHPETDETVILCRSADRRKERAMHDRFFSDRGGKLERLKRRIGRSKKRLDPAPLNRRIGRILQRNQRAAARFAIALDMDGCPRQACACA